MSKLGKLFAWYGINIALRYRVEHSVRLNYLLGDQLFSSTSFTKRNQLEMQLLFKRPQRTQPKILENS